jgi:hypothetical protein
MTGVCNRAELLDLAQPLLRHSVSFRRCEDGDLGIVTTALSWNASDRTASSAQCVGAFAVRLAETLLGSWPIPAASVANAKADVFKRVNFLHLVLSLLRECTNFEGSESEASTAVTTPRFALRPVHFTVTPGPSTANACKCAVSMVFAVESAEAPGPTSAQPRGAPTRALGRYLTIAADYLSSTMRGMGKSVSTDEVCNVTLQDVVSQRFSECRAAAELLAEDGAVLKQILSDFLTK